MNHWLVKSDPDEYSAGDLQRDGRTAWTGVKNPTALIHLRSMKAGDPVLLYHTGAEKAIVALATVAAGPRPDVGDSSGKLVVVDLAFERWLTNPVSLVAIKDDPAFKDFALVRIGRLSVMPVTDAEWARLMKLSGETLTPRRKRRNAD